ncbi:MAG TPA: hypothetical protein VNE39_08650 [Planctomycetota bacterium]|nr:hypothetical protein [Planctomycetota bacterium]
MRKCLPAQSLLLLCAALPAIAAENLAPNGDFELESPKSPPPGWAMWGASKYKDPKNFTRDTSNPHSGKACFRIHHPANTAGYVVSSPDQAIRTKRGMAYSVSFWARADKLGGSTFGFDAYESIAPYVDAPSPGFHPIEVGPEWKEFRFEIHEGWDFFADRARLLLLTFKATSVSREERTLWIDDVTVTEAASPRKERLVPIESIEVPPLEHRLQPGERVELTVDATKRLRRATRLAGGVSFHRVAGWSRVPYSKEGDYVLHPELEQAIREMRLPMTRFYAVGDEPFGLEAALDKAAALLKRVGIPQGTTVLELETQGSTSKLPPESWAQAARHSLARGYAFRHWEVANEPYLGRSGMVFTTPDAYLDHFLAVEAAVRKVQPDTKIGLPVNPHSPTWCSYLLQKAAGHYDFVVGHHYCFADVNRWKFEDIVLSANYHKLLEILKLNALIASCNPGRDVCQLDTEWGMHSHGPKDEKADFVNRNANIYGTLHRAVRLIYYTREDILRGASSWEMFTRLRSPGFGFLAQEAPQKRSMFYWLYHCFNRHVGDHVLAIEGTAPFHTGRIGKAEVTGPLTPVLVTASDDGKTVYVVMANGSWAKAYPCRIALRGFDPAKADGIALSHSDPDAHPFVDRREDVVADLPVKLAGREVAFTLPAHSVAFITLTAR